MTSPALKALLTAIRKHEAPRGYGQVYGGAKGVPKATDVSKCTLAEVMHLQQRMLNAGSASTAVGGYQFIRKTLKATVSQMGLKGSEVWDAELQDRMATHLMMNRGLGRYLDGTMSREAFANALAMEWASLPVVTKIKGQRRMVNPGETFYAGDDLNRAFHRPADILALLDALKKPASAQTPAPAPAPTPAAPVPAPEAPAPAPEKPRGLLLFILDLIASLFKRRS